MAIMLFVVSCMLERRRCDMCLLDLHMPCSEYNLGSLHQLRQCRLQRRRLALVPG